MLPQNVVARVARLAGALVGAADPLAQGRRGPVVEIE